MNILKKHTTEIWAQLFLSENDCLRIRAFLISEFGLKPRCIVRNMHITLYHARRPVPGIVSVTEPASVILPANETRFMVMSPGGENPRPELNPSKRKVGIRVHKQSSAMPAILKFRDRLLSYETERVLGMRRPSTHKKNAFGARHFQPHMTILRAGSNIDRNLNRIGVPFREVLGDLLFDRFVIDIASRDNGTPTDTPAA